MRLKFLTLLVLLVLSISISVTVFRYGIGVLQDNFIAQLSTNYRNSSEFSKLYFSIFTVRVANFFFFAVALYGLLNFYIFTMAYVYSPTNNAVLGDDSSVLSFVSRVSMYDLTLQSIKWWKTIRLSPWWTTATRTWFTAQRTKEGNRSPSASLPKTTTATNTTNYKYFEAF